MGGGRNKNQRSFHFKMKRGMVVLDEEYTSSLYFSVPQAILRKKTPELWRAYDLMAALEIYPEYRVMRPKPLN